MGSNREPHRCDQSCKHYKMSPIRFGVNAYQVYCDCLLSFAKYLMKDIECDYYERREDI